MINGIAEMLVLPDHRDLSEFTVDLSPFNRKRENDLLLLCARSTLEPTHISRIRGILKAGVDWPLVQRLAERNNVKQMLYSHLQAAVPDQVPANVLQQLKHDFHLTAQRNMFLIIQLLKVLDCLDSESIPVISYKGPVLASLAYGNTSLRRFRDLDLFVRERHVRRVRQLVESCGYQATAALTPDQMAMHLKFHSEFIFTRSATTEILEVHWKLTDGFFCYSPDVERLWKRAQMRSLANRPILTFSPADQLLFQCVHGTQHCWDRLEWISGLSELIRAFPRLDWNELVAEARRLGSERMLFLGMALAHELLDRDLPGFILERIRNEPVVARLTSHVMRRLFEDPHRKTVPPASYLFHINARERPRHRIEYLFRLAVTPTLGDWQWIKLPPSLSIFYYPLRIIRLAVKMVRAILPPPRSTAISHRTG